MSEDLQSSSKKFNLEHSEGNLWMSRMQQLNSDPKPSENTLGFESFSVQHVHTSCDEKKDESTSRMFPRSIRSTDADHLRYVQRR